MPKRQLLAADAPMTGRQAELWNAVAKEGPVSPLESKAIYVVGMLRHLIESAGLCLSEGRHLPAFLLAMDSAELLGAPVLGRDAKPDVVAATGLSFVLDGSPDSDQDACFAETPHARYSIRDCINRRHFAAHGGRKFGAGNVFDADLTTRTLRGLVEAMDRWWQGLRDDRERVNLLANADIVPLTTAGSVLFVGDLVEPFLDGAMPGGELQHESSWRTR